MDEGYDGASAVRHGCFLMNVKEFTENHVGAVSSRAIRTCECLPPLALMDRLSRRFT